MKRNIDMDQISDGKRYSSQDMVRIACNDCAGCSNCCHGMGNSIILDPYDFCRLTIEVKKTPSELLEGELELNVVDGIILPNIKMQQGSDACAFLNKEGRCSIHKSRPGFCRLFPLGRIYENGSFSYFNQIHECPYPTKSKVKIKDWLGEKDLRTVEDFVTKWHYFLNEISELLESASEEDAKNLNLFVLNKFYLLPYDENRDFFSQFEERIEFVRNGLGL